MLRRDRGGPLVNEEFSTEAFPETISTGVLSPPSRESLVSRLLTPFKPPLETIRHYNLHKLRKDLLAGLTVSVLDVPQAMAYAIIAGVPPQYGLYTSVIQGALGALLSSSQYMATGPTNTHCLLIASVVHRVVGGNSDPSSYLQLVFMLALLKGLIQIIFAAAQMGNMVRYVSRSVIAGLVSGAGVLIFVGQIAPFLGVRAPQSQRPGIIGPIQALWPHLGEANWRAVAIGIAVVLLCVVVRFISRLLPGALLAVVLSAGFVWLMGWTDAVVPLIHKLPKAFPGFEVPRLDWGMAEKLFSGALAMALVGMIESVAIAKSIAARSGEDVSPSQEFFGQGMANVISSFFHCMPGSASFTRSALDHAAGAATRMALVFDALFVAAIFLLLAEQAQYIPRAALAGVLFVIAIGLIEWSYIPRIIRASRPDAIVCGITFVATLVTRLEYAIFMGIFLNIGLYLRQASRLHVSEMVQERTGGQFIEQELTDRSGGKQVVFLQIEGDLFFGVADELRDRLAHLSRPGSGVRVVVMRLRRTHSIDSTALHVLEQFSRDMHDRNGHVVLCGVRPQLTPVLKHFGLIELIGEENYFETQFGMFASAKAALKRARQLIGVSIDVTSIKDKLEDEPWAYEI